MYLFGGRCLVWLSSGAHREMSELGPGKGCPASPGHTNDNPTGSAQHASHLDPRYLWSSINGSHPLVMAHLRQVIPNQIHTIL